VSKEAMRDPRLCFDSPGPEATRKAGELLSRVWRAGRGRPGEERRVAGETGFVISLQGELGAGKTVFVKGLARGLGIDEGAVSSPTFVLANQYAAPRDGLSLNHVDFYRLESAEELESMGFFDLMGAGTLLAVEWGAKFSQELPADRLELILASAPESAPEGRSFSARATGPISKRLLAAWEISLAEAGPGAV